MTAEEVERLMRAAVARKYRKQEKSDEQVLIYRLLLGTGLRSTELSLLTPNQIDFKHNRLTVEAAKTKNKKADILPLRPDLVLLVKEWIELHGIQPHERVFRSDKNSIRRSFYGDLKAAGMGFSRPTSLMDSASPATLPGSTVRRPSGTIISAVFRFIAPP